MTKNKNIKIIEQALGYPLSNEQIAILESDFKTPTLVNACAGAGKTTTMIISIIYQAMCGHAMPGNTLCVTFSKEAQLDMKEKYSEIIGKITKIYPQASQWQQPQFRTFHSFFLQALKIIYPKWQPVITSWDKHTPELYRQIKHPKEALTNYENVEQKMNLYDQLINHNYSYNGINVNTQNKQAKIILKNIQHDPQNQLRPLLQFFGILDDEAINDYCQVINKYNQIKKQTHTIDFSDIQTFLANALMNVPGTKDVLHSYFNPIHRVFLDEFQDISQIQWNLITNVIPSEAFNHLVAIGDDDQSIYRFRGSDPTFILNFTKRMPNAIKFNLSTNYRTYNNILNTVKPIIQSNTLRLDKNLKAFNKDGIVKRGIRHDIDTDYAIDQFIYNIKHNPDKKFAILARNNSSLSVITDKLANHEIYSDYGKSKKFIFQNTKLYNIVYNLMRALYNDQFDLLVKYSNRIGYNKMKEFLQKYQSNHTSLKAFLTDNSWSTDLMQIINKSKGWTKQQYIEIDQKLILIRNNVLKINEYKNADDQITKERLPLTIFRIVQQLTNDYFQYMLQNNYLGINKDSFDYIMDYLASLVRRAPSMEAFFITEDNKKLAMENQQSNHQKFHVKALTFHRSKGLEFDQTLIYTSSVCGINIQNYRLASIFPANNTIDQTIDKIIKQPILSLSLMMANDLESLELIKKALYKKDPDKETAIEDIIKDVVDHDFKYIPDLDFNVDIIKENQNLKNLIFLEINGIAKNVEEEKRLMYVAVTRAKDNIIFDQDPKNDIITQLLSLPKDCDIDEPIKDDTIKQDLDDTAKANPANYENLSEVMKLLSNPDNLKLISQIMHNQERRNNDWSPLVNFHTMGLKFKN